MYQLIAIDLDGTLLDSSGQVSPENIRVLDQARAAGLRIVLASGRPPLGIARIRAQMGNPPDEYLITFNGALTRNLRTGTAMASHGITAADYQAVAAFADSWGLNHYGYDEDACLSTSEHATVRWERDINGVRFELVDLAALDPRRPLLKAMAVGEPSQVRRAMSNLPDSLRDYYTIVSSAPNLLEFHNPQASKGQAVASLAASLGIPRRDIMAIGDSGNDLDMIRYAGLGVAMGNATEEIRAAADYITTNNDRHGVAEAIRTCVLDPAARQRD